MTEHSVDGASGRSILLNKAVHREGLEMVHSEAHNCWGRGLGAWQPGQPPGPNGWASIGASGHLGWRTAVGIRP